MARIQAGSTLVNQYAPPFVVSDSVAQGWELVWSDTLNAFEAVDPSASVVDSGFDSIEVALFTNATQQTFVVPFIPDTSLPVSEQKAQFIITLDGAKQHIDAYTISVDTDSVNTTITLVSAVTNANVEVLGLQVSGGASIELFGPYDIDLDVANTVNANYDLGFLAGSEQSVFVSLDGVKQQTSSYSLAPNVTSTSSILTFSELPTLYLDTATGANAGSSYFVGEVLTLSGVGTLGTGGTAAQVTVDNVSTISAHAETNFDGAGANGTFTAGTGHAASDVITMSDGTQVTVGTVGGGGDVLTFSITGTSTAPGISDMTAAPYALTQTSTTGGGTGFALSLGGANVQISAATLSYVGDYVIYNGDATYGVTGGSGSSATFTVTKAASPRIEVIGIKTAGETPASPVNLANLDIGGLTDATGTPGVGTRAEVFSSKTLSGDEQIFYLKDLEAGSGIEFAQTANRITISTNVGDFANIGSGEPVAVIPGTQDVNNEIEFKRLAEGTGIALTSTATTITIANDLKYFSSSLASVDLTVGSGDEDKRLISLSPSAPTTVLLPLASSFAPGETITIKDANGGAGIGNTISVDPDITDRIDGGTPGDAVVLNTARAYITLYSNGVNDWYIIGQG